MNWQRLLIILIILLSLLPVAYLNQQLQKLIQPRRSFLQLILYFLAGFAIVFIYTFLLVWIITKVFPQTNR